MTESQENSSSQQPSAAPPEAETTASSSSSSSGKATGASGSSRKRASGKAQTATKVTSTRARARKTGPADHSEAPDEETARALAAAARNVSGSRRKAPVEQTEFNLDTDDAAWRPGSRNGDKDPAPDKSQSAEEKPAPKARAKKAAKSSARETDDSAAVEKPQPRARRTATKKTEEADQDETAQAGKDEKPKAQRGVRKSTATKKSGDGDEPKASQAAKGRSGEDKASGEKKSGTRKPKPKLDMDAQRMAEIEAKAREAEARAREAEARAKEAEARAKEAEYKASKQSGGGSGGGGGQKGQQHQKGQQSRGQQKQQNFKNRQRPGKKKNRGKKKRDRGRYGGGGEDRQQHKQQQSGGGKQAEYGDEEVPQFIEGIVEISGKGFGFLRDPKKNFNQTPNDVFVTPELISKFHLRDGQMLYGETRKGQRGPQLASLLKVNNEEPGKYQNLPNFEELTVLNPMERLALETEPGRFTTRILDLITPIGKGQRGLIVSPPRSGKTTLLQHIAEAITKNYPSMPLIFLLVDERPEEVTELRRAFPNADVMASSNDNDVKTHTRIAQLAIDRAKRLVEAGHDVFMLLDSITRMARAFNNASTGGGKTGSGGIDLKAMEIPRRIFAGARNTEEAGSLTIIASALIDTGSRMDDYIFQEFKGTGNMDVYLDRKISDQLIFPAIDIFQSGTRREELILPPYMLEKVSMIRRGLAGAKPIEAIQRLIMLTQRFETNFELLNQIKLTAA